MLVTINYRLGLFGFLNVDGGESNCGLSDVLEALRWVQREIAAFGGDPDNVTVFGESAGAMLCGSLLVCPQAAGLFHRVILQSGAGCNVLTSAQADVLNREVASVLGLERCTKEALEQYDAATLLALQNQVLKERFRVVGLMAFQACIDGDLVPEHPMTALLRGSPNVNKVDVLLGFNRDEHAFFRRVRPPKPSKNYVDSRQRMAVCFGRTSLFVAGGEDGGESEADKLSDEILQLLYDDWRERYAEQAAELPPAVQDAPMDVLDRLFDDFSGYAAFGAPALLTASALDRVFVYEVAHESPFFYNRCAGAAVVLLPSSSLIKNAQVRLMRSNCRLFLARLTSSTWTSFSAAICRRALRSRTA